MNSLQLVSKIRTKTEDLTHQVQELLNPSHSFTTMDKDLLRKQCLDLYELILKLRTDQELGEDRPFFKANPTPAVQIPNNTNPPLAETEVLAPLFPDNKAETIKSEPELDTILPNNFQEVINWADQTLGSLDELVNQAEIKEEEKNSDSPPPGTDFNVGEELIESKNMVEIPGFGEINIGKATENKRIQYTVLPDPVPVNGTLPLNETFAEKPLTYNDKIAQTTSNYSIPLAEKTIDSPIDNIKSAINLNKKIALVNELFRENVVDYAKAIDRLNNATDSNDAFRIHHELKHLYNWDNSNELVQELERLIRRRFS